MLIPYLQYKLQILSPRRELFLVCVYGVSRHTEVLHSYRAHLSIASFALLALGRAGFSCDAVGGVKQSEAQALGTGEQF